MHDASILLFRVPNSQSACNVGPVIQCHRFTVPDQAQVTRMHITRRYLCLTMVLCICGDVIHIYTNVLGKIDARKLTWGVWRMGVAQINHFVGQTCIRASNYHNNSPCGHHHFRIIMPEESIQDNTIIKSMQEFLRRLCLLRLKSGPEFHVEFHRFRDWRSDDSGRPFYCRVVCNPTLLFQGRIYQRPNS